MLAIRIVGVINILNNIAVQSINYNNYLPIGRPDVAITYLNKWGIDEIVILDIKGSINGGSELHNFLPSYVKDCQVPVAAGGGISNLTHIENLIRNGADKVVINTSAHTNSKIIEDGAREFGEQAIVVSYDLRKKDNDYYIFIKSGSKILDLTLEEGLKQAVDRGAGEIFISSIDRDGTKKGYDIELLKYIKERVSIPIIGCGGAGNPEHFLEAMNIGLSALAAGNYFHYTEHSVIHLKSYLKKNNENIRLDTYANYLDRKYGIDNRLMKLSDDDLEELKFQYIPEEKL